MEGIFLTGLRPATTRTGVPVRARVGAQQWLREGESFTPGQPVKCDLVVFHESTQRTGSVTTRPEPGTGVTRNRRRRRPASPQPVRSPPGSAS